MRINIAAKCSGKKISDLLELAEEKELAVYAWDDWFWFTMEEPFKRYSVDTPILMDDEKHLYFLAKGKSVSLHVDSEQRFICKRGATDDSYLDGVDVTVDDLFFLKSEIDGLKKIEQIKTLVDDGECSENRPWDIPDPKDPEPKQPWYIPARYFARQHVKANPSLVDKRDILAKKIAKSLDDVGIKKRGGVKPLSYRTILKALSNVILD